MTRFRRRPPIFLSCVTGEAVFYHEGADDGVPLYHLGTILSVPFLLRWIFCIVDVLPAFFALSSSLSLLAPRSAATFFLHPGFPTSPGPRPFLVFFTGKPFGLLRPFRGAMDLTTPFFWPECPPPIFFRFFYRLWSVPAPLLSRLQPHLHNYFGHSPVPPSKFNSLSFGSLPKASSSELFPLGESVFPHFGSLFMIVPPFTVLSRCFSFKLH